MSNKHLSDFCCKLCEVHPFCLTKCLNYNTESQEYTLKVFLSTEFVTTLTAPSLPFDLRDPELDKGIRISCSIPVYFYNLSISVMMLVTLS